MLLGGMIFFLKKEDLKAFEIKEEKNQTRLGNRVAMKENAHKIFEPSACLLQITKIRLLSKKTIHFQLRSLVLRLQPEFSCFLKSGFAKEPKRYRKQQRSFKTLLLITAGVLNLFSLLMEKTEPNFSLRLFRRSRLPRWLYPQTPRVRIKRKKQLRLGKSNSKSPRVLNRTWPFSAREAKRPTAFAQM